MARLEAIVGVMDAVDTKAGLSNGDALAQVEVGEPTEAMAAAAELALAAATGLSGADEVGGAFKPVEVLVFCVVLFFNSLITFQMKITRPSVLAPKINDSWEGSLMQVP